MTLTYAKKDPDSPKAVIDAWVHVVGSNLFNNELLTSYLQEKLATKCLPPHQCGPCALLEQFKSKKHLVFFDCSGFTKQSGWDDLGVDAALKNPNCFCVLFNVDPQHRLESEAIKRGVRGALYLQNSITLFPQAARAVMNGELWYSRKILARYIHTHPFVQKHPGNRCAILSPREQQILLKLAAGVSNQEIADALAISPHTVKTHAYNIYKKIGVTNRLQAGLWSKHHL
jgi:DNA-binding CsgD family transcriptional regulator